MALITKAVKGTKDVLPGEIYKTQYIESTALDVAERFGFKEIRTPVFEHTELFQRGVGDTTDVVQKEALQGVFWKTGFATKRCRRKFAT